MDLSVLVVDDDSSMLKLLDRYLTDAGFRVLTAGNGAEALDILRDDAPPLVITDCQMPQVDGMELCHRIRTNDNIGFAYIIMLTVDSTIENLTAAFDAGADDYLTKPFNRKELLARMNAGVRLLRAEQRLHRERRTVYKVNAELEILNRRLETAATTDDLTGLGNRRTAMARMHERWSEDRPEEFALSCMVIDVDHFKRCNDSYGHDAGDLVLREVASQLRGVSRSDHGVYRLGGEEFLVLCPRTDATSAAKSAELLRAAIDSLNINYDGQFIKVAISIGVAERDETTPDVTALLRAADNALYAAKRSGRNRVVIARDTHAAINAPSPEKPLFGDHSALDGTAARVLLVDSDPDSRRLIIHHLARAGHVCADVDSGQQALDLLARDTFDVIVMDIVMSGMDGFECVRRLRAHPTLPHLPILMMSGRRTMDDVVIGFNAGADGFVTKPVQPDEFVTRVEQLARSSRQVETLRQRAEELASSNSVRAEQARAMGILFDLARSLSAVDSEGEIFEIAIQATADLLICQRVSIMVPTRKLDQLRIARCVGLDDEVAGNLLVPVAESIAGEVFSSQSPFIANSATDLGTHPERYRTPYFASVPLASVAVGSQSAALGVLNVTERFENRPFNQQDLEFLDLIANMTSTSIDRLRHRLEREQAQRSIVTGLATLAEYRDNDTGKHLDRVTQYALLLARDLQGQPAFQAAITDQFLLDLQQAMPLHDIGKVAVTDAILRKPGMLTPTERQAVQHHTHLGAKAIQAVIDRSPKAEFLFMARDIAHFHHERFDGTGYPTGLAGTDIPLAARIASVADVYDALSTKRPYKQAYGHAESIDRIKSASGRQFDPDIVASILRCETVISELAKKLADDNDADVTDDDHAPLALLTAG